MLLPRLLRHDRIRLEMSTPDLDAEQFELRGAHAVREHKEAVLREIADFLEARARVGNARRLHADLVNRERKASTAVGGGLAIPHVRTMNVKEPTAALLRSTPGLEFGAPDGGKVHVYLVLVAPPYDDRLYLKVYKEAAELFLRDDALAWLLKAESESDVLNFLRAPERFSADW